MSPGHKTNCSTLSLLKMLKSNVTFIVCSDVETSYSTIKRQKVYLHERKKSKLGRDVAVIYDPMMQITSKNTFESFD